MRARPGVLVADQPARPHRQDQRNLSTGAPREYVERVFQWTEPAALAHWRGAQYSGEDNSAVGQTFLIELMLADLEAVRAARGADATDAPVRSAEILASVTVKRVAGTAPNACEGP